MTRNNPHRDPAADIELGDRARQALMSAEDWREVIELYLDQEMARYRPRPDLTQRKRDPAR